VLNVIAVDPAPAKESTVFDGRALTSLPAQRLSTLLAGCRGHPSTLVCWDAPLTGPTDPSDPGVASNDFSQRRIEPFFSRSVSGFKAPAGISVMPYCGCPHWAISRALLGLPRVGPWDVAEDDLPFSLLSSDLPPEQEGHFIVEVHPAVAAWLWCKVDRPRKASWKYKTDRKVLLEMWEIVRAKLPGEARTREPKDDDEFDALVAYGLGVCWLKRDGTVGLLGNRAAGAFLVPTSAALSRAYARFGDVDARPPIPPLQRTGIAVRVRSQKVAWGT
jgi:hypothetical protein